MSEPADLTPDAQALLANLKALHAALRADTRARWDRDLPFEELVFDRWERARSLGFGDGANVYHNSYVMWDVKVGANTWIGPFCLLDGRGGITIGEWCCISAGVHVYTHDSIRRYVSGGRADLELGPVVIEDCVYVGPQSVVLKGVTIGKHSVIGAQSLVNRDVPPYSVAFGTPARVRGKVEIGQDGRVEYKVEAP